MLLEGESRDYEKMLGEDYSSDNERKELADMCENKYNIDSAKDKGKIKENEDDDLLLNMTSRNKSIISSKDRTNEDGTIRDATSRDTNITYTPNRNTTARNTPSRDTTSVSTSLLYPPPPSRINYSYPRSLHVKSRLYESSSQMSLLDYLKEEARAEAERINTTLYEKKSYSPKYEERREEIQDTSRRRRGRRSRTNSEIETLTQFGDGFSSESELTTRSRRRPESPGGEKRSYRKRKQLEYNPTEEDLDMSNQPPIESFADFADSMFKYHTKDRIKVYECPKPGCYTELPSLSRIKRHYLIHTTLKPFKCLNPTCKKRFSRKDNMIQHYRTHCSSKHNRF